MKPWIEFNKYYLSYNNIRYCPYFIIVLSYDQQWHIRSCSKFCNDTRFGLLSHSQVADSSSQLKLVILQSQTEFLLFAQSDLFPFTWARGESRSPVIGTPRLPAGWVWSSMYLQNYNKKWEAFGNYSCLIWPLPSSVCFSSPWCFLQCMACIKSPSINSSFEGWTWCLNLDSPLRVCCLVWRIVLTR